MGRKKTIDDLKQYKADFIKNNYENLTIRVKKGEKQIIKDHAKSKEKTLNKFVNDAIKNEMERK